MPSCLAFGCANRTGRDDKSYFKIPDPKKDPLLCSRWLHNIGNSKWTVKNFEASKDRVVCSNHFHPDCFKRDLKFELMPQYGRSVKTLKPGAIPTIFTFKTYDQINIDGTVISNKDSASRKRSLALQQTHVRISCYFFCISPKKFFDFSYFKSMSMLEQWRLFEVVFIFIRTFFFSFSSFFL